MERLAKYLAKELSSGLNERHFKILIQKALSKLDKQDLLKMLNVKQCQCRTKKKPTKQEDTVLRFVSGTRLDDYEYF